MNYFFSIPVKILSTIKEIIIEYHFNILKDKDHSKLETIKQKLRDSGFNEVNSSCETHKSFATILYAKNNF